MNKQDIQETINELHRMKKRLTGAQGCSVHHEEANAYSAKCLRLAISALEKQIPKKPIIKPWSPARCPSCGNKLSTHHGDGYYTHRTFMDYCDNKDCLQRLDWGDEDE